MIAQNGFPFQRAPLDNHLGSDIRYDPTGPPEADSSRVLAMPAIEAEPLPRLPALKTVLLIVLAFFAATFAIYGHSLRNDFVRWDDGMLVYENPAIREISPRSLAYIFTHYDPELYIPLTFLTYQIEYQLGGQGAFIYHFNNLLLHTLNALLTAWFVFLLGRRKWLALLCGLLFAVHPLHAEAVEWVSARKDVLSTFFFLFSVIAYMHWREDRIKRLLLFSLAAFAFGLVSKVMVITLPVILLLIDWKERRRISLRMLTEKIPYIAVAGVFGVIAVLGKTGVIQSSTLSAKILMACKSAVFYLEKLLWPTKLSLLYPYVKPITLSSPDFFIPIGVLIALAVFAWWTLRWGRGVVFGLAFYLVTVAPTFINFAKGGELDVYFASDRYAYIPSIGIFYAVAWLAWTLLERYRAADDDRPRLFQVIGGVMILVFAVVAFRQSFVWRNTETLFQNVLAQYPESSHVAHNNLGNVYRLRGELDQAVDEYKQAIAIRPHAKTISNLGATYRRQGLLTEAHAEYQKALTIHAGSREAHLGLGLVLLAEKRYADAEARFREAARIDPTYEEAFTNLGVALLNQGKTQEAITAYRQAIEVNPYFPDARYNLAVALESTGQAEEALHEYLLVIRMVPTVIPARINAALLQHRLGQVEQARRLFEEILRLDPANRAARSALQQMGAG
jgi:protein O-mannosyl-transferase